jgi:Dyp-type peroxidase family
MTFDPTDLKNFELLSKMQGNILKGHGRNHTTHIFIQFYANMEEEAKQWMQQLAAHTITSAQKQLKEREVFKRNGVSGGLFASFYLTAAGYRHTGLTTPAEGSFNKGMKHQDTKIKLSDPDVQEWEEGYRDEIHAMLLLAHSSEDELARVASDLMPAIEETGRILHIEFGNAIRNENGDGLEHFGYVDGISQPLFLKDEIEEFRQGKPKKLEWDPEADIDLVLVQDVPRDPNAKGSYFVFRKLEQKVKGFKTAEQQLASALKLKGEDRERAGAMLVGRYEDGTPLTLSKEDGIIASGAENNFNYNNDTASAKCPFHAHIRKSNPRNEARSAENEEAAQNDKAHIMARRGIPYGTRQAIDTPIAQMPVDGIGLLFMSYQASISNQFEFIQSKWVNNPDFPHKGDGSDPILGQGGPSNGAFAVDYGNAASLQKESFNSFVTLKGGEYFFAPSIAFLKSL